MKKKCCFLLLLMFFGFGVAQNEEILPEQPWKEIVEMNCHPYKPIKIFSKDVNVGLFGLYTKADSLAIVRAVEKLDSITETIRITYSNAMEPNVKITFLDSIARGSYYGGVAVEGHTMDTSVKLMNRFAGGRVNVYKIDRTDLQIQNSLESRLAVMIAEGSFSPPFDNRRKSIFNPFLEMNNSYSPLNNEDVEIIKEVYKAGFEERLVKAEKIFKKGIEEKVKAIKIAKRDRNLWWVKNPISVIFIPVLLLVLISLFFVSKFKKLVNVKVKNELFRFTLVCLVSLLFLDMIIIFSISFYDFLITPKDYGFSIIRYDTVLTTIIFSLICFPFLYLFRFLEFKILKTTKSILVKTGLMFLSSGILPFCIVLILMYISVNNSPTTNHNTTYSITSYVFLLLMSFACIRALISFFVFKEKNLLLENEDKISKLKTLKANAELKSLQSQINPHFLYNSLNSIASLASRDAKKTQQMAYSLSDLFKYSINRKGKKMSTVLDEVNMVKTYLEIEKIRFGNRLQFFVMVDKDIEDTEIPLFLIQPLVENSVKHGVSQNEGVGIIELEIVNEPNTLEILVSDNGPNFPEGLVSGHGLQMVYDLLRLTYDDQANLNWTNTPKKKITITIPKTAANG